MNLAYAKKLPLSIMCVGVDGGATHVRAHEVEFEPSGGAPRVRLGPRSALRRYGTVLSFQTPEQRGVASVEELGEITPAEREQGWAWIEATVQCVLEVARARNAKSVLLGVAMPGLKTTDGRGIAFANNGPRIPEFAARLEDMLSTEGVQLAAGIERLESDGWCCGVGESFAEHGSLRGQHTAYYVGGGTGLAEALVLDGELVHAEDVEDWCPRAWTLRHDGLPFEAALSARGINQRWAACRGFELPLEKGMHPEDRARSDPRAGELFAEVGRSLAELVMRRIVALETRGSEVPDFPGPYTLERVVLGQRLGALFADPRTLPYLRATFESTLDAELKRHQLDGRHPPDGGRGVERRTLVRTSELPHAASIGAAMCALSAWSRVHG